MCLLLSRYVTELKCFAWCSYRRGRVGTCLQVTMGGACGSEVVPLETKAAPVTVPCETKAAPVTVSPPRIRQHSTSVPDVRLGRADLNISRALQEMSIQELSVALSHHSTNRSLLGSASWAVDASEIRFGRRLGAGAYGEVYEAEWRRSRVAVKRLLTAHPLEEKGVREFFAEMEILASAGLRALPESH